LPGAYDGRRTGRPARLDGRPILQAAFDASQRPSSVSAMRYHITRPDRLPSILRDGLRPGAPVAKTDGGLVDIVRWAHGSPPVFLANRPWIRLRAGDWSREPLIDEYTRSVLLRIDDRGLRLMADIPALTTDAGSTGATAEPGGLRLAASHPLARFADTGGLLVYALLRDDPECVAAATGITATVATADIVEPRRIRAFAGI
jgi:hypothetical protein